jgi:hypothetical protein
LAKTGAERQKKYRESHGGDESKRVVNVGISVTVVTELKRLCKEYGATKRAMVERLIMQGVVEEFSGADKARELLAEHGDQEKALKVYRDELKSEFPGFTTKSRLPEHAEARRRYDAVRTAMHRGS